MTERENNTTQTTLSDESSTYVDINVSPELECLLDNAYVKAIHGNRIYYTNDFYIAMYKNIHDNKMTSVEAYASLGFDVEKLGKTRAEQAGKNAMNKAKTGELFASGQFKFDGSVSPEELPPDLSEKELLAYYMARCKRLETIVAIQKKIPSILAENSTY